MQKTVEQQAARLVKLLEAKNIKQAKTYLDKIQKFDSVSEQIVSKAMQQCLIAKKTTPLGFTSALYLYRQMLIRSQFDYLQSQSFNQKIHKLVYQICQYNQNVSIQVRGKDYFKQKMKVQPNQQTELMGNTVVILALEVIQAMASWYPKDFISDQTSRYVLYYEKLKQKRVVFPDPKTAKFMKLEDKKKFDKNYQVWVKKMQELYEQQQTPQGPVGKMEAHQKNTTKTQPVPPINGANPQGPLKSSQLKGQQQMKVSNQPQIAHEKQNIKQSKGPVEVKPIATLQDNQRMSNNNNTLPLKSSKTIEQQRRQQQQNNEAPFILPQPKQDKNAPNNKIVQPTQPSTNSQAPHTNTNNQPKKSQNVPQQPNASLQKKQVVRPKSQFDRPKNTNEEVRPPSRPDQKQSIFQNRQPSARLIETPAKNLINSSRASQSKPEQAHKIQPRLQVPHSPPKHSESPHVKYGVKEVKQLNNKNHRRTEQAYNNLKSLAASQISMSKNPNAGMQTQNIPKEPIISQTVPINVLNRKQNKMEKPFEETTQINQRQKKSLPKTQKKNITLFTQGIQFLHLSPEKKSKFLSTNNQFQTLSDLRNIKNRKKVAQSPLKQFMLNEPILTLIDRTKLGQVTVPFLPEYFHPVDIKMQALILQSLRIGAHPTFQPSKRFYQNDQLAVRLIKSQGSYILSLHNVSHTHMLIGFSQALFGRYGNQFSCQIRVRGLQRKKLQQVTTWRVDPNQFVDIPFDFYTCDPNFKFLQFPVAINSKILTLHLPITLLDQGDIQKILDLQQISSFIDLHGRIFKSPPISLSLSDRHQHYTDLPPFFSHNKNKDSKILGQMSYRIQNGQYLIAKIYVFIKQISSSPQKHEIHALYDNRLEQNEDFAKVILELLCFLMSKHHN